MGMHIWAESDAWDERRRSVAGWQKSKSFIERRSRMRQTCWQHRPAELDLLDFVALLFARENAKHCITGHQTCVRLSCITCQFVTTNENRFKLQFSGFTQYWYVIVITPMIYQQSVIRQ